MGMLLSFVLGRRYAVLDAGDFVPAAGEGGPYLILPNHPALVDPLLVYARFAALKPRPMVTAPVARLFRLCGAGADPLVVPEFRQQDAAEVLQRAVEQAVDILASGRSVLFWPGERLQDNGREVLRGATGVYRMLRLALDRDVPLPELFLVRTEGLWGSRFSRYFTPGQTPGPLTTLMGRLPALLWGPLLPRRPVRMVLRRHKVSAADCATVDRLNGMLANWYDAGPQAATLVPAHPGGTIRHEAARAPDGDEPDVDISPALALLGSYVPVDDAGPAARLLEDLGIDSRLLPLVRADFKTVTGRIPPDEALTTVARLAQALDHSLAVNAASSAGPVPTGVLRCDDEADARPEDVQSVLEPLGAAPTVLAAVSPALLRQPPLLPAQHAMSRQGTVTDVTLGRHFSRRAVMGLAKAVGGLLRDVPGGRVGVALPGGVAAQAAFIACLDSTEEGGRVPVFLNCRLRPEQLARCAEEAGITHVVTSHALEGRGLPPGCEPLYLEGISKGQMRRGYAASLWGFAGPVDVDAPAAVIFTSGTEGDPKGVLLTHRQLMANLRAVLNVFMGPPLRLHNVSLLCGLPPWHVFGLSANILLPLTCGIPAVTVSDPGDFGLLARSCRDYAANLFVGTPGQLRGLLQAAPRDLPLRWAVVGAEACPPDLPDLFRQRCPNAVLVEGYGATECAPAISVNVAGPHGSVGPVLPGLEHCLHEGQLFVRGESVFTGYLDGSDPRVALPPDADGAERGEGWYPTGDLMEEDAHGFLYFRGRLRAVAKRGEEIIAFQALERALGDGSAILESADGRIIAVRPGIDGPREINARLRDAGFLPPWKVDATLDALVPRLGDGSVDYETLRELV